MPLTKALGQFVADLSPNRLPEGAVAVARLGFIDSIGTMIAGRNEDCVQIMKQVLAPRRRTGHPDLRQGQKPRAGSRLDQRHRGACAGLRRCRRCAAIPARCWYPRSWPRPKRWDRPAPT